MINLYPYRRISDYIFDNEPTEKLNGRLVVLEERFFFAYLCWKRLQEREKRYKEILSKQDVKEILIDISLREIHADEHFFFLACGDIYKDIQHQVRNGVFAISDKLMERLNVLKEERRVHTHGADWYWGSVDKKNPPKPNKGTNYDFDKNMELLNEIYAEIVKGLEN